MHRRNGFTLVELLIVVVIIGILATIAANLFWGAKEQAFRTTIISDLKVLSILQEQYHADHMRYTTDATALNYIPSDGVEVTILEATGTGWSAVASHTSYSGFVCGLLIGDASNAGSSPAAQDGVIACN